MKYRITKYHLKTKEELIAAFTNLEDAEVLIVKKISNDEINKVKASYRIYDDLELIQEFISEQHTFIEPEDPETFSYAQFAFNVQVQAINSKKRTVIAYFNNKEDAHLFVTSKFSLDVPEDARNTYLIFKGNTLIDTITKNIVENKAIKDRAVIESEKSTSSSLSQRPIPRPTPSGGPTNYWAEKEEDEDNNAN